MLSRAPVVARSSWFAPLVVAAALFAPATGAQLAPPAPAAAPAPGALPGPADFRPAQAAEAFVAQHGPEWRVRFDRARGVPEHLYGGGLATAARAGDPASFERAARDLVDSLGEMLGISSRELQLVGIETLPLGRVGSTDKLAVVFDQVVDGLRVHLGRVHVLFDSEGRVLSLDSSAQALLAGRDSAPSVSLEAAAAAARARFLADAGVEAASIEFVDYLYWGPLADVRQAALPVGPAYAFRLHADAAPGTLPAAREILIAAQDRPLVLSSQSLVHDFDLTGTVRGWVQPGLLPQGSDPEVLLPLKDVRMTAPGQPAVFTNAAGQFTFPGVNSALTVTASLAGNWSTVMNSNGAEHTVAQSVSPGVPSTFTLNPSKAEETTAQVNAHRAVQLMRDYLLSLDPSETTLDFPVLSNTNIQDTCNAYYDGVSINFFLAGGGCVNTAYSSVVWHELGHWMNDLYGHGNNFFGMGEGGADVWAMFVGDDPVMGKDFGGPGDFIRSGLNTNPFCGDENLGCYGESHADGQPLMGAIWKVRAQLQASLGAAAGEALADQLVLSWWRAYDDILVRTTIEEHFLVLDDNDANLANGTPHFAAIDAGFGAQGFPPFQLPLFQFSHAPLVLVRHEGSVPVTVSVTALASSVAQVRVFWSTNDGQSWSSSALAHGAGSVWSGSLPGVVSPEIVSYYFEAQNPAGVVNTWPAKGAAEPFHYDVGERTTYAFFNFENLSDEGWTHQQLLTQDDWQHEVPAGKSFDPPAAFSGSRVWGNDLGNSNFNGAYQPSVDNVLRSPVFNLAGATHTHLRFRRWLSVEKSEYDHATITVDGSQVWENPFATQTVDDAWRFVDFDIGTLADNDSSVQVEFRLVTDGGLELGGWNLDDVEILGLAPAIDTAFVSYGVGTPGFGGQPPLLSGTVQAVNGGPLSVQISAARPNALGFLFIGTGQAAIPGLGGTFLVANFFSSIVAPTNALGFVGGTAALPADLENFPGAMFSFQWWCVDPAGPEGFAGTNGLFFVVP